MLKVSQIGRSNLAAVAIVEDVQDAIIIADTKDTSALPVEAV